jgi:hypothetical protein
MDPTNRWTLPFVKLLLVQWTCVIGSVLLPVQCLSLPMLGLLASEPGSVSIVAWEPRI